MKILVVSEDNQAEVQILALGKVRFSLRSEIVQIEERRN